MTESRQKSRSIPSTSIITTATVVGLGWGLALGLFDALPAVLEGDPAIALGRRLLSLTYVATFNALVFGLVLSLVGLLSWAALRVTQRRVRQSSLLALYVGSSAALSTAAYGFQHFQAPSPAAVAIAALVAGGVAGWLAHAAAHSVLPGNPAAAKRLRMAILVAFGLGALVFFAVAMFRQSLRDLPALNPRVTDQAASPERPNIVLISIDALRADALGVYGNELDASPRIDDLAARGTVFGQAIAQGSSTVPAVASFMTSLYPTELGISTSSRNWVVDDLRVTLAEALQVAGYRTQAFVTNGHLVPAKGYAQGFDGYVAPEPGQPYGLDRLSSDTVVAGLACRYKTFLCDPFEGGYRQLFDRLLVMQNEGIRVNDLARRFIRLHGDEQFFLWLHYMEPHAAYSPTQPMGGIPPSVSAEREAFLRAWTPANKTIPMVLRPEDAAAVEALYDGEVLDIDAWVGGIWDEIEAQGLADRTLLVITADHGEEFTDHGGYGHGHSVYQELNRVPLILVGPQVSDAGRMVETAVPMLDLMPTLLDVANAPLPELLHGESLLPVLEGGMPAAKAIFSEAPTRRSSYEDKALIQGGHKLVYDFVMDRAELYDVQNDPGEQRDLVAAEPQLAAALRDELRTWTALTLQSWASLPHSGKEAQELDAALQDALRQIGY